MTSTKQPKIEESFKQWTADGEMTERVDKAVISLICTAGLPFSFVEEPGFKNLLHILQPQYKIRSRKFFVYESLPNMYQDMVDVVKKDVSSAPFVSLCIDSWSSEESTHSLLGVTCHFLKENFEPTHVLLAASPIKGSHTGDKIASLVAKVITNFGIDKKVHMVIRDNESAMQKATRIAGLGSQHCSSHKIQLAIGDGLKLLSGFKEVIERVKKAVRRIRKPRCARDEFAKLQDELGLPQLNLRKGIEVRWNSTFLMLERFTKFREVIQLMPAHDNKFPVFSELEWKLMRTLCRILSPAYKATIFVQNRKAGIAGILPLFSLLERKMISSEWTEENFPVVREKIANSLNERMRDIETEIPQLEDIEMHNDDPFEEFLRERSILMPFSQPSPSIADAKAQAAGQVTEYLNTPRFEGRSADFWKNPLNAAKFPLLLPLVRKYHSAPMSSSECERVFSVAKYILDDRRKNITMENLEKQLFLHENLLIYGFKME
uniref:HAT C-terminal dimerisation domain-containing protein n=1 Tax=Meloidogyne incognita TaxID=6306 RepID=A0A914M9M7_MELIC